MKIKRPRRLSPPAMKGSEMFWTIGPLAICWHDHGIFIAWRQIVRWQRDNRLRPTPSAHADSPSAVSEGVNKESEGASDG